MCFAKMFPLFVAYLLSLYALIELEFHSLRRNNIPENVYTTFFYPFFINGFLKLFSPFVTVHNTAMNIWYSNPYFQFLGLYTQK